MTQKPRIYAVVGPTASGKSTLALELAKRYGGEIVSLDSMQLYRRMNVGTAKPTAEEMAVVTHHLIDVAEPTESFSAADYVTLADKAIREITARGKLPIICGGTGLYLDALLRGSDFGEGLTDDALRAELLEFARVNGAEALHAQLRELDEESAEAIHPNNVKRVARAIEICRLSGQKKSEIDRRSNEPENRFDVRCVGLFYPDRSRLYERIDARVDAMLADGLVEETKALMDEGVFLRNSTAAQAIGYKELMGYIRGEESLDVASERLKMATRRYAKRQITWFSAKKYVTRLEVGEKTFEEIVNNAAQVFFS